MKNKIERIHKQKGSFTNTGYCEKGVCIVRRDDFIVSRSWKKVTCKKCLRKLKTEKSRKIKKKEKAFLKRTAKEKDKEWADKVKERDGYKCVYCGDKKIINAAHIIPREIKLLKHILCNGITLCPKHHKFSFEFSAHQNPFLFNIWFIENRQEQYMKLLEKVEELNLK